MRKRGFTLIELLVVIAIIGILTAIVLANVQNSRYKAKDASAISSINSIRAVAELFHDSNNNTYADGTTNVCSYADVVSLMNAAKDQTGNNAVCDYDPAGQGYHVYVQLNLGSYYCIDSDGFAGIKISAPTAGFFCDRVTVY